jgi:2',3'-cyclic-nucleotide 2'-phosphodiesterase
MKILFIGDIVGKGGRETVKKVLPGVREEYAPDIVIANAENLSHGNGFTPDHIKEMQDAGVDFFTSGHHVWGNKNGVEKLDDPDFPVLRPANYPSPDTPGRGFQIIEDGMGNRLLIINIQGQVFIKDHVDSPFRIIDEILEATEDEDLSGIFVDFHAEATSEKNTLGLYLDGRVSAFVGTHTHVATADARIFENGTAYLTDAGMVGAYDSSIGVKKELIIKKFLTQMPTKHEPELEGKMVFGSVLIEIDDKTKKALDIKQVIKIT